LFAISEEETKFVNCQTGLPTDNDILYKSDKDAAPEPSTYGEITSLGSRQLFDYMGLIRQDTTNYKPNYQFFDLGSGGGRLVMQSHLELPSVIRSVGIELSPSRSNIAIQTWDNLVKSGNAKRIRKMAEKSWGINNNDDIIIPMVELIEGDLFELDISKATHMYIASLCFSEEMLERLVDKIEREGENLQIVATIRELPLKEESDDTDENRQAILGRKPWQEYLQMSWTKGRGEGCPVHFYSVSRPTK